MLAVGKSKVLLALLALFGVLGIGFKLFVGFSRTTIVGDFLRNSTLSLLLSSDSLDSSWTIFEAWALSLEF